MREILFRAKRIDSGQWVQSGTIIQFKDNEPDIYIGESGGEVYPCYDSEERNIISMSKCLFCKVDPKTVGRYTGQKDKNGNKIWENDIVKCGANTLVRWSEKYAGWCLAQRGWMHEHFFGEAINPCDCEVIGNIFDNPEVLKLDTPTDTPTGG